jgi:hypothetical protein
MPKENMSARNRRIQHNTYVKMGLTSGKNSDKECFQFRVQFVIHRQNLCTVRGVGEPPIK